LIQVKAVLSGSCQIHIRPYSTTTLHKGIFMTEPIIAPAHAIHACRGMHECRHSVLRFPDLIPALQECFHHHDLEAGLCSKIQGPLRHHHRIKVSISLCPNGCSQPQIADIGLLGAGNIRISENPCTACSRCIAVCRENAITLSDAGPIVDPSKCILCQACTRVCPEKTLETGQTGMRIQLGGKLGRHPMLGRELDGMHSEEEVLEVIHRCLQFYLDRFTPGKRLGDLIREMSRAEFETEFHP
jgi:dissimilatory sulfite reductase (desulfoviridin) alpha/beta subunit